MTTLVFVRRFLADYARNPVNLLLLVVVPTVFVIVVAGSMADTAQLLGGVGGPAVETATAGWAAAFLAGIAMYFQTAATRETDRRIVVAGLPPGRLVLARLSTGTVLAVLASAAALVALWARSGIDHPQRVLFGTLMFAVIYVAIGTVVGSFVGNPVNGTIIVMFVWIFDVFFGPAMGAADRVTTRGLPTHFVTLWMVDLPSGHGGRLGDLGWALVWTTAAVGAAWLLAATRSRAVHPPHPTLGPEPTRAATCRGRPVSLARGPAQPSPVGAVRRGPCRVHPHRRSRHPEPTDHADAAGKRAQPGKQLPDARCARCDHGARRDHLTRHTDRLVRPARQPRG
jgi:hypothetical protein